MLYVITSFYCLAHCNHKREYSNQLADCMSKSPKAYVKFPVKQSATSSREREREIEFLLPVKILHAGVMI